MAFKKPVVNTIKPDIKNLSIYLRSQKKWGKSTLFRDMIIEKYGDLTKGLLVGCGNEVGYTMLDNLNATQIETYKDIEIEENAVAAGMNTLKESCLKHIINGNTTTSEFIRVLGYANE